MKIMDVTLRESVYYGSGIDYDAGLDYLKQMVRLVSKEDIQYIEFGYINTDEPDNLNYNEAYINEAVKICGNHFKPVAMMHPGKADMSLWNKKVIGKLEMVRIVVNSNEVPDSVKDYIEYLHGVGVEVSVNIAYALNKTRAQLINMYEKCRDFGADYIYYADSSGSAVREDICYLSDILKSNKGNNQVGLHLHNHLGMAFANALTAHEEGLDITDVSITGAGKGGGNLKTEMFIPYLRVLENRKLTIELFQNMLEYIRYFDRVIERDSSIHEQTFIDSLVGIYKMKLKEQEKIEEEADGDKQKYINIVMKRYQK